MQLTFDTWEAMHTSEYAIVRKFYRDWRKLCRIPIKIADFVAEFNQTHQGEITVIWQEDVARLVFELTEQQLTFTELRYPEQKNILLFMD